MYRTWIFIINHVLYNRKDYVKYTIIEEREISIKSG